MTSKKKAGKPAARRVPLTVSQRETMLAVLIRNQAAHAAVRDQLTPGKLAAADQGLAVVWEVACRFHDVYGRLPKKKQLLDAIGAAIENSPGLLTDDEVAEVKVFVRRAFNDKQHGEDLSVSDTQAEVAVDAARRFLEDQLGLKAQAAVHDGQTLPADLPGMLQTLAEEAGVVAGLSARRADVPFPDGWDRGSPLDLFPTGISVLDSFLGGGHKGGEVYLFMGPFGSCKTTVAVMGLVEGVRHAAALKADPDWDGREPLCVIASYETPVEELRERCLSYAASIPRTVVARAINGGGGLDDLSTSDDLRDYEKSLFKAQLLAGEPVPGERERADEAIALLNDHAVFLDMTGAGPQQRGAGNGYVPEIARAIDNLIRGRKNSYPLVVWVDYLGALAKRHIAASGHDYSDLRHLLSGGVLQLGAQVAKRYDCPVWVTHQLSGEANSRPPAARMHHTDAAEAKNAAENADFAIVTGNTTEEEQLCVFYCTKHRREPPHGPAVVRVEGRFNRVVDVRDEYVVDRHRNEIITRDESMGIFDRPDVRPFPSTRAKSPYHDREGHLG